MESKRELPTVSKASKNILFTCLVWVDGLGDLGHLISTANPAVLKKMPIPIDAEAEGALRPIYLIACDYSIVQFVIREFVTANMLPKEELRFADQLDAAREDEDGYDEYLEEHMALFHKRNPTICIVSEVDGGDDLTDLRKDAEEDGSFRNLEDHIQTQIHSTGFSSLLENTILQVNISTRFEFDIYERGDEAIPFAITIGEHASTGVDPIGFHQHVMGFADSERGIFIEDKPTLDLTQKIEKIAQMQDRAYLYHLLDMSKLGIKNDKETLQHPYLGLTKQAFYQHVETFLTSSLFIPGYIHDQSAIAIFITGLAMSRFGRESKEVVFHLNKKDFSKVDMRLLKKSGFTDFELNDVGEIETIKIQSDSLVSKKIRVLTGFRLSKEDYNLLPEIAQVFVGCSGDKSFESAIKYDRVPFLTARYWKTQFAADFVNAAEKYSSDPDVKEYNQTFARLESDTAKKKKAKKKLIKDKSVSLESSTNQVSVEEKRVAKMSKLIAKKTQSSGFVTEYKKVIAGVKRDYNFYDYLPTIFRKGYALVQLSNAVLEKKLDSTTLNGIIDVLDDKRDARMLNHLLHAAAAYKHEALTLLLLDGIINQMIVAQSFSEVFVSVAFQDTIVQFRMESLDEFKKAFYKTLYHLVDEISCNEKIIKLLVQLPEKEFNELLLTTNSGEERFIERFLRLGNEDLDILLLLLQKIMKLPVKEMRTILFEVDDVDKDEGVLERIASVAFEGSLLALLCEKCDKMPPEAPVPLEQKQSSLSSSSRTITSSLSSAQSAFDMPLPLSSQLVYVDQSMEDQCGMGASFFEGFLGSAWSESFAQSSSLLSSMSSSSQPQTMDGSSDKLTRKRKTEEDHGGNAVKKPLAMTTPSS